MPILKMDKYGRVGEVSTDHHNSQNITKRATLVIENNTQFSEQDVNARGNQLVYAANKKRYLDAKKREVKQIENQRKLDIANAKAQSKNNAKANKVKVMLNNAESDRVMEAVTQGFQRTAPGSNFDNLNVVTGNGLMRNDGPGPATDFERIVNAKPFSRQMDRKQDFSAVHQFVVDGPEIIDQGGNIDVPAVVDDISVSQMSLKTQKKVLPNNAGIPKGMSVSNLMKVFGRKK